MASGSDGSGKGKRLAEYRSNKTAAGGRNPQRQ